MGQFTISRAMTAPADRVWEIVGNPGTTPGRGIVVEVERPAAENGSGLVRAVRIGRGTFREQITSVGPGRRLTYRLLSGAPVREYLGTVDVAESGDGGSRVRWTVRYRPRFPGTGWLVAALSKRSLNKVLDLVETQTKPARPLGGGA